MAYDKTLGWHYVSHDGSRTSIPTSDGRKVIGIMGVTHNKGMRCGWGGEEGIKGQELMKLIVEGERGLEVEDAVLRFARKVLEEGEEGWWSIQLDWKMVDYTPNSGSMMDASKTKAVKAKKSEKVKAPKVYWPPTYPPRTPYTKKSFRRSWENARVRLVLRVLWAWGVGSFVLMRGGRNTLGGQKGSIGSWKEVLRVG